MLERLEDTDTGPRQRATTRLCAATRVVRPVGELIRFVLGPDGAVVPDLKRRLPGRGVWVTATQKAVDEAVRRKVFARALRAETRLAPDFTDQIERLMERSALDALAIAHKAGRVAVGFAKADAAIANGPVAALIHASDAAPDGVRKLNASLRRRFGEEAGRIATISAFTSMQLDLALGRPNMVHAALLAGPASNGFLERSWSLVRFRTSNLDGRDEVVRD